jgi:hypothetical protein
MSLTEITPDRASTLSVLVNSDRIRSSVKRLFHNRIDEVLSEILQNAQRAGATKVDIITTEDTFTIRDNGHGLLGHVDGFHTLLKLAESNFDSDTIDDQDPMGVGIVSLLTHDQISEVTFSSGTLELIIDTKRWWNDPDYYSVWYERLTTLDQPVLGLQIFARCTPELVKAIDASLKPKDVLYTYSDEIFQSASPAQGYKGILAITLNSRNVRTSPPNWTKLVDELISTTYQGSKLRIGYNGTSGRSSVLWYGQLIKLRGLSNSFDFHLEVTSGRPINPLSPSRTGIIEDSAYSDLRNFIKEQIFSFVFDTKNRATIQPAHVEACFRMDNERALANSPYIVAQEIQTTEHPNSLDELNSTDDLNHPNPITLFTYDEAPLLLNDDVFVQKTTGRQEDCYGLPSFLPQLGSIFTLRYGDQTKLNIGNLWWAPEGTPQHDWFHKPGTYGISYNNEPPTDWLPVTETPVFTFSDSSSYDASEVNFTVGTNDDPIDFLNNQVWAGFSANDENDYDPQQESYQNSISDVIRSIIGKCVPSDFTLYDVRRFLKDQDAPIISISYHYKNAGKFINPRRIYNASKPNSGRLSPSEITVKTATGEKVRLKLY